LREVARQAGVSAAAPSHHFAGKAALVEALTVEGYEALTAALHAAWAAEDDPAQRIAALGVAYVRFAVAHPAAFRLMFRPELRGPQEDAPLAQAAAASYGVLVAGIRAARDAGTDDLLILNDGAASRRASAQPAYLYNVRIHGDLIIVKMTRNG